MLALLRQVRTHRRKVGGEGGGASSKGRGKGRKEGGREVGRKAGRGKGAHCSAMEIATSAGASLVRATFMRVRRTLSA